MTTARNRHQQRRTPARPRSAAGTRPRPRAGASSSKAKLKVKQERRRQARCATLLWSVAAVVAVGLVATAMLVTRSSTHSSSVVRVAPPFTLTSTSGKSVSLASYRGHNIVLYFSEGVGCDPCFSQMREFETRASELTRAGITVSN